MKVFITGATGLVGYHAVRFLLAQATGIEIVALTRKASRSNNSKRLKSLNELAGNGQLRLVEGELSDHNQLVAGMHGADVVVHCAGAVNPHARREDIYAVNVEGTRSVLKAAVSAGAGQFVHISSLSVITGQKDQYMVNEQAQLSYCGEAYADSKVDAEKLVQEEGQSGSIKTTVLRPGFIYGPGEQAWMPRLIESLAQGKVMLIDGGSKETNVIYVDNLSRAIALSLLNPKAYGQVFNLTDGHTPSKKQLFDAICEGLGLPKPNKRVPGFIAQGICDLVSTVAPWLPPETRKKLSRYSRAAYRLAGVNQGFDISKAEKELGYNDRIPFAQAMSLTLKSFKSPEVETRQPASVVS